MKQLLDSFLRNANLFLRYGMIEHLSTTTFVNYMS